MPRRQSNRRHSDPADQPNGPHWRRRSYHRPGDSSGCPAAVGPAGSSVSDGR